MPFVKRSVCTRRLWHNARTPPPSPLPRNDLNLYGCVCTREYTKSKDNNSSARCYRVATDHPGHSHLSSNIICEPNRSVSASNDSTDYYFSATLCILNGASTQSTQRRRRKKMAATALSPSTPPTKFTMFRTTWIIYSILVFRFFPIHSIEMRAYFIPWMVLQWRPRRTKLRYIVVVRGKTQKENKSFIFQFNQWLKANWEQQQWDRRQQQEGQQRKKSENKFVGSGSRKKIDDSC